MMPAVILLCWWPIIGSDYWWAEGRCVIGDVRAVVYYRTLRYEVGNCWGGGRLRALTWPALWWGLYFCDIFTLLPVPLPLLEISCDTWPVVAVVFHLPSTLVDWRFCDLEVFPIPLNGDSFLLPADLFIVHWFLVYDNVTVVVVVTCAILIYVPLFILDTFTCSWEYRYRSMEFYVERYDCSIRWVFCSIWLPEIPLLVECSDGIPHCW